MAETGGVGLSEGIGLRTLPCQFVQGRGLILGAGGEQQLSDLTISVSDFLRRNDKRVRIPKSYLSHFPPTTNQTSRPALCITSSRHRCFAIGSSPSPGRAGGVDTALCLTN